MSSKEINRKIADIFLADVVGYSKHMEKDEDKTLKSFAICEKIPLNFFRSLMEYFLTRPETLSLQNFQVQ